MAEANFNSDEPRKRMKYIPGGPGGGGRFIEVMETQTPLRTSSRKRREPDRAPATAPVGRSRRDRGHVERPTYDSAAAAAAAAVQSDGYKPREEKGWEDFHSELDLDTSLQIYRADDVDGHVEALNGSFSIDGSTAAQSGARSEISPAHTFTTPLLATMIPSPKRRPGRPPRRPEAMLNGLGSPPAQRIVPLPAQNPRERLVLPKPSFQRVDTFARFENDKDVGLDYVDERMANVGYQESELFHLPEKKLVRFALNPYGEELEDDMWLESTNEEKDVSTVPSVKRVEYDMDEQDLQWLEAYNAHRRDKDQVDAIKPQMFEIAMTQIEKEWHALEKRIPKPNPKPPQTHRPRSSSAAAVNGEVIPPGEEQDSKCAICDDGDCENSNAIVFCDGCDLAVHQECYGVPFIPEGQWLCRKCQLVGRATPTCVFCPNIEGAFKLTHESRWAHLICAIWIPEVTLANTTFMEPIMDVASVPRNRWKLTCYICHQKMGACIQCGNKNCFQAFHVTCARRAKLFLKMKSTHGGSASFDASVLKAYCDKHVPFDWRREQDTDTAILEAKAFYAREMRGRKWADSQQSALAYMPTQIFNVTEPEETKPSEESVASPQKRRRNQQPPKNMWRLPSGAPIVPQIVFNAVESSLMKFTLTKRREFVAEACKYWSLKREARRGAALLKRLQLQMETFSTSEIARRDFVGMGAVGGPRLQRRIEFAERLENEMQKLRDLCHSVREREKAKRDDTWLLKDAVDTVYFPVTPLLWPILRKAQRYDKDKMFVGPLAAIERKLNERQYSSVSAFSADIGAVFRTAQGADNINNGAEGHTELDGRSASDNTLPVEHKEVRKLAKRIVRLIHEPLREAMEKEAELGGRPFERELRNLETVLGERFDPTFSSTEALEPRQAAYTAVAAVPSEPENSLAPLNILETAKSEAEVDASNLGEQTHQNLSTRISPSTTALQVSTHTSDHKPNSIKKTGDSATSGSTNQATQRPNSTIAVHPEPLTPPSSEKDLLAPLSHGGIPWYLEPFDPIGTTIQDERWTGQEVLRSMSEELSEMEEDDLVDLQPDGAEISAEGAKTITKLKTHGKKKKRPRRFY